MKITIWYKFHMHTEAGSVSHTSILVSQQEFIIWINLAIITITIQHHYILWFCHSFHKAIPFGFWSGILSYECHQSSMLELGLKFFIESLTVLSANKSFKMSLPSEWCLIIYLDELKNRKILFLASHWTLRLWKATGVMLKYLTSWMS